MRIKWYIFHFDNANFEDGIFIIILKMRGYNLDKPQILGNIFHEKGTPSSKKTSYKIFCLFSLLLYWTRLDNFYSRTTSVNVDKGRRSGG